MTTAAPILRRSFDRLRALAALARPQSIPHVQQAQWADCGAACLAMVLAHHGKHVTLDELRREMGAASDGISARAILETAARHGLVGRTIQVDDDDMASVPRGAVLHWHLRRFVVWDGLTRDGGARIVDPAYGPRVIPLAALLGAFTGVALVLEPGDAFERSRRPARAGGLGWLLAELRAERAVFARILVASLLLRVFALAVPLLTALVVDKVLPRSDRHLLWVAALGVGFLVSGDALGSILRAHLLLQLRTRIDARRTLGFVEHLVSLPCAFFRTRSTGDLLQRVGSNATVREIVTSSTLSGLLDGCFALIYAVIIVCVSPPLGLLVLVLASLNVSVFLFTRRRHRQLMARDLEAQSTAQGHLAQMLSGIETLKCTGAEGRSVGRWFSLYSAQLDVALERGTLAAGVDTVRQSLGTLAPIGILTIGALAVTSGQISLGAMLAISALAGGFFGPLSALVASALQLQTVAGHLDRIDEVLATPREQDGAAVTAHSLDGAVAARQISFRYHEGAPLAVAGVSVDIAQGASIALVGPSGSGKSTLANLLVGLCRPTDGELYYDGRPLSQLDLRSVRRQIGVVPQSPFVFGASVRDNIALGAPDADLGQIEWAARTACIHESILAMPMGYDTILADGGVSLSGGQRQRLAIARAILSCPTILMLDEATSALDALTENRIMNHLGQLGATRIIVGHRLSTIVDADLILVMDQGRVVEAGTHRELLGRRGLYTSLVGGWQRRGGARPPLEIAS
jgi:ABC-type bacteriocin/lantibiotic exporter with double-glycine peptidase domain